MLPSSTISTNPSQSHHLRDDDQSSSNSNYTTQATQTEILGASGEYYQVLQNTAAPSKTARKRHHRNKNKKANPQNQHAHQLETKSNEASTSNAPQTNASYSPTTFFTSASTSTSSSDIEITTDHESAPLPTGDAPPIPALFTSPQYAMSLRSDATMSATDISEAERYLSAEQRKLHERMKLCQELRDKIDELKEAQLIQREQGTSGPAQDAGALVQEVKVLRAKWIADL